MVTTGGKTKGRDGINDGKGKEQTNGRPALIINYISIACPQFSRLTQTVSYIVLLACIPPGCRSYGRLRSRRCSEGIHFVRG